MLIVMEIAMRMVTMVGMIMHDHEGDDGVKTVATLIAIVAAMLIIVMVMMMGMVVTAILVAMWK